MYILSYHFYIFLNNFSISPILTIFSLANLNKITIYLLLYIYSLYINNCAINPTHKSFPYKLLNLNRKTHKNSLANFCLHIVVRIASVFPGRCAAHQSLLHPVLHFIINIYKLFFMWQSKNLSQVNKTYELCVLVDIYGRQVPQTSQRQSEKKNIYKYIYIYKEREGEISGDISWKDCQNESCGIGVRAVYL